MCALVLYSVADVQVESEMMSDLWSRPFFIFHRKILAPGEEEHLEFEEDDEEGGAGAGSPDSFPARVPGRGTNFAVPTYTACVSSVSFSTCDFKSLDEEHQAVLETLVVYWKTTKVTCGLFSSANYLLFQIVVPIICEVVPATSYNLCIPCTFLTVLCEVFQIHTGRNCGNVCSFKEHHILLEMWGVVAG